MQNVAAPTITRATTAVPVAPPPTRTPEPEYDVFLRREQHNDAEGHRDSLSIDIRRDVADAAFRGIPVNLAVVSLKLDVDLGNDTDADLGNDTDADLGNNTDADLGNNTAAHWLVVLRSIGTDAAPATDAINADGQPLTAPVFRVGSRRSVVALTGLAKAKDPSTYGVLRIKVEGLLDRHKLSSLPGPAIGVTTNQGASTAQLDLDFWVSPEAGELWIWRTK